MPYDPSNPSRVHAIPGYHLRTDIPKGVFGELSKVREELAEAADAIDQGSKVMLLMELCDVWGAVTGYLIKHNLIDAFQAAPSGFPTSDIEKVFGLNLNEKDPDILSQLRILMLTIHEYVKVTYNLTSQDVAAMAKITLRAFQSGERRASS